MKIVIVAGGTGGHFYPGLAVAKACLKKEFSVQFIVRRSDYILPFLEREKIPYYEIYAAGLKRSLDPRNILVFIKIFFGWMTSIKIFLLDRPDVVIAMGGYLSLPPAMAANLLRIPVVLHEQNVIPGLANKLLGKMAKRIALSFEKSASTFPPTKITVTGNPVREEFRQMPSQQEALSFYNLDTHKKTILVFGGSLGAHFINFGVAESLSFLKSYATQFQFLHFTGMKDETAIKDVYSQLSFNHYVSSYCHEMEKAYAAADLVVCRAGATTIAELLAVRKPALLIPYPYATAGHQRANANVLADMKAAEVYEEKELQTGDLKKILQKIMDDPFRIDDMRKAYQKNPLNPFHATAKILQLLNYFN